MSTNRRSEDKLIVAFSTAPRLEHMDEQTPEADQTLADRVVAHLTQAIISGELRPGTRISEPKRAKHHGISRGPLSAATRSLPDRLPRQRRRGACGEREGQAGEM